MHAKAAQQISLRHDIEVQYHEQLLLMFICSWLAHVRTQLNDAALWQEPQQHLCHPA